jgi:hypothetical protein
MIVQIMNVVDSNGHHAATKMLNDVADFFEWDLHQPMSARGKAGGRPYSSFTGEKHYINLPHDDDSSFVHERLKSEGRRTL